MEESEAGRPLEAAQRPTGGHPKDDQGNSATLGPTADNHRANDCLPSDVSDDNLSRQLGAILSAAAELQEVNLWQVPDSDLLPTLACLDRAASMLAAVRLPVLVEVDSRGLVDDSGSTSAIGLLRHRLRWRPRTAAKEARLAAELPRLCPEAAAALAHGEISKDHAHVLVTVLRQVPPDTEPETWAWAVDTLLDAARKFDPADTARIGRHLLAGLDPDGKKPEDAERRARARREFTWSRLDDGGVKVYGRLDPESAATLITALDPLAAPRPYSEVEGVDPRSAAQRRADALVALAEHAMDRGELPIEGGERPHLALTAALETLTDAAATGGALLNQVGAISVATARRLACDARVVPIVMGGESQPLDVGRASRAVPPAIRRALVARDGGCAFPGCDRPPSWCQAHHIVHWANGGSTSLNNLVMLCAHHHRRVHHDGWLVRVASDGLPEFATPALALGVLGAGHAPPPAPDQWWRRSRREPGPAASDPEPATA